MTLTQIDARKVTGLADGATVTAANSASPDQFTPLISAPGTVKWRAEDAIAGVPDHWEFDGSGIARGDVTVNSATVAIAVLGYMTSITTSDNLIVRAFSASTSVSLTFRGATRTLDVTANGGAILDSSPGIPIGAYYRINFGVLKGTTTSNGAIRVELFIGANVDGTIPDWTFTSTAANTGTVNFTALRIGKQTSGPVHTYRMIAARFSDTQETFDNGVGDRFTEVPTVRAVEQLNSGVNSVTGIFITHTAPTDIAVGDQMTVMMMLREPASTLTGWRVPAGWTERETITASGQGYLYTAEYGVDVFGTSWTWDNGAGNTTGSRWASVMTTLKGDLVGDYLSSNIIVDSGAASATPALSPAVPVGAMVAGFGSRTTGGVTWDTWNTGWTEVADTATQIATNAVTVGVAVKEADTAGTYSATATPSLSVANGAAFIVAFNTSAPPEVTDTLSMGASGGFSIGGSLSAAAVLAMDAIDGMVVGALRTASPAFMASAAGALTVAGVKSRLSVLPVAGLGSLAIAGATGAVSTLAVSGAGALAIAGSESRTAVWAAVAAAGLAVGAVRTQPAVLPVAGVSGLAIGTLYTRLGTLVVAATSSFVPNTGASAVWTARGTPLLVVGTVQSYLRVLAVRGTPAFAIGAVLIGDYHPNRRVTAAVLDSGLRKAVLLDATRLAKLLSPSYQAVITRGT